MDQVVENQGSLEGSGVFMAIGQTFDPNRRCATP